MPWHITDQIHEYTSYEEAHEDFRWDIPDGYNVAWDMLRKHDDPAASVALFQAYPDGRRETYTFHDLDVLSNKLANALEGAGVGRGDRVAIIAPQKPPTALTYLACWKLGAVCVPISILYGHDGMKYRLNDSGARVALIEETAMETLAEVRSDCPELEHVVRIDSQGATEEPSFEAFIDGESKTRDLAATDVDTRAMIQYTSGTTGPPKGVVLTHGVVPGFVPGFYMMFDRKLPEQSIVWAPADWAWITGPFFFTSTWHYGRPIVGYPMGPFDAHEAFDLMAEFDVNLGLFPPTALRMMSTVDNPADRYDLSLEVICGSGEPITSEIYQWVETTFEGVTLTEAYGQTEADPTVADCPSWFEVRPGSMGKPILGHDIAVIDNDTGEELPTGEIGEIAVRHEGDPVILEEYWNKPEKTDEAFLGEWYLTGDLAEVDDDGYYWYKGRADDIIITSGYRVGPDEVESAILEHPNVEQAGVIGVPDDMRGERIKAFIQTVPGVAGSDELANEIRDQVRERLAKYQYPREIEFVDALPMTTTGKIRRTDLREREGIAD